MAEPIVQASADAPASVRAIYDEYFEFMWRSAHRLGVPRDRLDDVIQDTLVIVHRRLATFEGRSSFRTWLFGILLRVVRDHARTLRRKSPHAAQEGGPEVDELPHLGADPEAALAERQAAAVLYALLDQLDAEKREIFVFVDLEGFTVPEVAEMTGENINTLYKRLRTARSAFETALASFRAGEDARRP